MYFQITRCDDEISFGIVIGEWFSCSVDLCKNHLMIQSIEFKKIGKGSKAVWFYSFFGTLGFHLKVGPANQHHNKQVSATSSWQSKIHNRFCVVFAAFLLEVSYFSLVKLILRDSLG